MKRYIVGFDPSWVTMGVAIKYLATGKMELYTGRFNEALQWVNARVKGQDAFYVVENANLNSTVFGIWSMVQSEVKSLLTYELLKQRNPASVPYGKGNNVITMDDVRSKFFIAMKHAQRVGKNKSAADYLLELLDAKDYDVIEIAPSQRERADRALKKIKEKLPNGKLKIDSLKMPTKTTAEQFKKLTGHVGRTNEHNRDAATMIHDKKLKWCEAQSKIRRQRPDIYKKDNLRILDKDFKDTL